METNVIWSGREYNSMENCLINVNNNGSEIISTILGSFENIIYKVDYCIRTNRKWETVFFEIDSKPSTHFQFVRFESDGEGNWIWNGKRAEQFHGCIDVDISLTPFTNTLPVNRLGLNPQQSKVIKVIYCNLLKQQIKPVRQKYTCLSNTEYHFENIPKDFEATIQVDDTGLVVDYPPLFVRKAFSQVDQR